MEHQTYVVVDIVALTLAAALAAAIVLSAPISCTSWPTSARLERLALRAPSDDPGVISAPDRPRRSRA